ncbi:helix-turn-helix transcriptional regulator [Jhaorihella thermophila]
MRRADRLHEIIRLLRDGQVHRADGFARRLGVSVRTIYRDMERLARAGVPVEGARGVGYRLARRVVLPPLTLTGQEVDALNLGLAIVAEAPDPDLRAAALSLVDKLDAALPAETIAEAEAWKAEPDPLADAARGFFPNWACCAAPSAAGRNCGLPEGRRAAPSRITEFARCVWTPSAVPGS